MKKIISVLMLVVLLCAACIIPAQAADSVTVKRVVAVSKTQLVIEFSEPVAINMKGSSRGPWFCIRAIRPNTGDSLWGVGPREDKCIQFLGSYEFLDDKFDRILWTLQLGSCYDNPSIESIVNHEGDMKEWFAYPVVFFIEEVPFDEKNPTKDYVDNITSADGQRYLANNVRAGGWAACATSIEFDYEYDLGLAAKSYEGTQKITLKELSLTETTEPAPVEPQTDNNQPIIYAAGGAVIGAVIVLAIVGIVSLVRKKKSARG